MGHENGLKKARIKFHEYRVARIYSEQRGKVNLVIQRNKYSRNKALFAARAKSHPSVLRPGNEDHPRVMRINNAPAFFITDIFAAINRYSSPPPTPPPFLFLPSRRAVTPAVGICSQDEVGEIGSWVGHPEATPTPSSLSRTTCQRGRCR